MEQVTRYIQDLQQVLDHLPKDKIDQIITILHEARLHRRQIFILGIGNSAPTASQFVADLSRIPRQSGSPGYKAIGLNNGIPDFSASPSEEGDESYSYYQLENLLSRGDILIVLSVNGTPKSVMRTFELANRRGSTTIAFTGMDGGYLTPPVDVWIRVPSQSVEHVEDTHLILENLITQILREEAKQVSAEYQAQQLFTKSQPSLKSASLKTLAIDPSEGAHMAERSRASLEIFTELSQELAYELELHDLLRRVLKLLLQKIHAASGTFVVLNDRGEAVEGAMAFDGEYKPYTPQQYAEFVQHGLAGWVVNNRQAALISNTRDDPRWLARPWDEESGRARSAISVPLIDDNRVVGILTLVSGQPGGFSDGDLSLLAAVAMFITLVNYAL